MTRPRVIFKMIYDLIINFKYLFYKQTLCAGCSIIAFISTNNQNWRVQKDFVWFNLNKKFILCVRFVKNCFLFLLKIYEWITLAANSRGESTQWMIHWNIVITIMKKRSDLYYVTLFATHNWLTTSFRTFREYCIAIKKKKLSTGNEILGCRAR